MRLNEQENRGGILDLRLVPGQTRGWASSQDHSQVCGRTLDVGDTRVIRRKRIVFVLLGKPYIPPFLVRQSDAWATDSNRIAVTKQESCPFIEVLLRPSSHE